MLILIKTESLTISNCQKNLQILGDKVGWFTARYLAMESGRSLLKQIEADYNLKAKFIHVIRNPFDNIATMAMRLVGLRTGQHTEKVKKNI